MMNTSCRAEDGEHETVHKCINYVRGACESWWEKSHCDVKLVGLAGNGGRDHNCLFVMLARPRY